MESQATVRDKIRELPQEPGVYRFLDAEGKLMYVGKAKNLRKRVSSYFSKQHEDRKTRRLASLIRDVEYTVVDTEFDALLLENNLIKQFQPRYNILLRDDKSYPYICVTHERFPRVFPTRQLVRELGTYFGPYASLKTMNTVLGLFKKLYSFRTCRYVLSEENVRAGKFKVCLEFHIGNCKGPCEGRQDEASYNEEVAQAVQILKGNLGPAKAYFRTRMQHWAEQYAFEKAQWTKDRLDLLEQYQSKSVIVSPTLTDLDVLSVITYEKKGYLNYLKVTNGMVVLSKNMEVKFRLDETPGEILALAAVRVREQFNSLAPEIITNVAMPLELPGVTLTVPQRGDKFKLVELSVKNALFFRKEKNQAQAPPTQSRQERILRQLQADLRLPDVPYHIECFDNSNLQGTNPVAAMVCFRNGVPARKDYRHFKIKTVTGANDFASMAEIVLRRYRRLLDEAEPLPQLIVVDGGKGQLSAACESLRALGLYGQVPIIGIAKRLEEIYYPEDPVPLHIDKKSESLRLVQHLRDEAHRFAIEFHRQKRNKSSLRLEALDIPGIGKTTVQKIYREFRSLQQIKAEDRPALEALVGKHRADLLFDYLQKKERQT